MDAKSSGAGQAIKMSFILGTYVIQKLFNEPVTACLVVGLPTESARASIDSIRQILGIPFELPISFEGKRTRPACNADFWYIDESQTLKTFDARFPPCRTFEILEADLADEDVVRVYAFISSFRWNKIVGQVDEISALYRALDSKAPGTRELFAEKILGYKLEA